MHFGRVEQITGIDLSLPEDAVRTERFLNLGWTATTKVYAGCPIWAEPSWVGSFYPPKTRKTDFLSYYGTRFNGVEVNSTFYKILSQDQIKRWAEQVPQGFKFSPKIYREITERLGGLDMSELLQTYVGTIRAFGDRLGLAFAQLPEYVGPQQFSLVEKFLRLWPKDLSLAVEFRHPGWFQAHALRDEAVNLLYRYGVATVITDTPGRRDALHLSLTQPRVMVRFLGFKGDPSDKVRLDAWADRFKKWSDRGLEELYIYTHQPGPEFIPETARFFQQQYRKRQSEDGIQLLNSDDFSRVASELES